MISTAFSFLSVAILSGSSNALALFPRQQDPSIPTRWSPDAPTDVIPDSFSLTFNTTVAQKGGWPTDRYFTNSIEWLLDQAKHDFNEDIGAVQLWEEGATFNLKANPVGNPTFPRRILMWGLFQALEYRLQNDEWRPGQFALQWDNVTQALLDFVDNPAGDSNIIAQNETQSLGIEREFRTETKWLKKTIIRNEDYLLPIARMSLSAAIFGPENVVASPLGWDHTLTIPRTQPKLPVSKVDIHVFEPEHPGGALQLKWEWVSQLLKEAVHAQRLRGYAGDVQIKLLRTAGAGDLVGTLNIEQVAGFEGNGRANGTAVEPAGGSNGTIIEPVVPPAETGTKPIVS